MRLIRSQTNQEIKTRASLKIATLNMRGHYNNGQDKWLHINQIIRNSKTGILALQETHLTEEEAQKIESLFSRLHIISSVDTQNTNAKGVAIVINRDLLNFNHIQKYNLIPGHVLMAQLQ